MTEEMRDRIVSMANLTWQAIGADVLQCVEDAGENIPIGREEVVEMVGDCDRMAMYGDDREAFEVYKALDTWEKRQEVLRFAFPHPLYGW